MSFCGPSTAMGGPDAGPITLVTMSIDEVWSDGPIGGPMQGNGCPGGPDGPIDTVDTETSVLSCVDTMLLGSVVIPGSEGPHDGDGSVEGPVEGPIHGPTDGPADTLGPIDDNP